MLSSEFRPLLEQPNTAVLVTLGPDGSPHASPVWFCLDGTRVLVSTTEDRQKHRNVRRDPRVALTVFDPASPLRYVEVRGLVTVAEDPDGALRDRIARSHGFADGSSFDSPGARRVVLSIDPVKIIEH